MNDAAARREQQHCRTTQLHVQIGAIDDAVVMMDSHSRKSRGFGFVTFAEQSSVERLTRDGRCHMIRGKVIDVKPAVPQEHLQFASGCSRNGAQAGLAPTDEAWPPELQLHTRATLQHSLPSMHERLQAILQSERRDALHDWHGGFAGVHATSPDAAARQHELTLGFAGATGTQGERVPAPNHYSRSFAHDDKMPRSIAPSLQGFAVHGQDTTYPQQSWPPAALAGGAFQAQACMGHRGTGGAPRRTSTLQEQHAATWRLHCDAPYEQALPSVGSSSRSARLQPPSRPADGLWGGGQPQGQPTSSVVSPAISQQAMQDAYDSLVTQLGSVHELGSVHWRSQR